MYKKPGLELEVEVEDNDTSPTCSSGQLMQIQLPLSPSSETMEGDLLNRNPLLNDLILDKVFQYVVGFSKSERQESWELAEVCKNVQNFRLVCKLWLERATLLFRKVRPVMHFYKRDNNPSDIGTNSRPGLKEFVDTMRNSSVIPVDSYYVEFECSYLNIDLGKEKEGIQLVKDFFEICAPEATELDVLFIGKGTILESLTGEHFPNMNLTTLKKLSLDGFDESPDFVRSLLLKTQNLEEFSFNGFDFMEHPGKLGPSHLVCQQIPKTVKVLRLDECYFTEEHLSILAERDLKLTECQIDFKVGTCSKENFHGFFKRQSGNLKKLTVNLQRNWNLKFYEDFPIMEKLEELELKSSHEMESLKMQIGLSFPNLHTLDLRGLTEENLYEELVTSEHVLYSLRKLYLPYAFRHADMILIAVDTFPGVKSLHVSPSPDISKVLRRVFLYFEELEELSIELNCKDNYHFQSYVGVDAVLSGVPVDDCKKISEGGDFSKIDLKKVQWYLSLLNLKNLKVLSIINPYQPAPSDFSAHFILMKMPLLEEFRSHRIRMTPTYVEQLRGKLKIFQVRHICGSGNCTSLCDSIDKFPFDLDSSSESEEDLSFESEDGSD